MVQVTNGNPIPTVLTARPRVGFVDTPFIKSITERAMTYIEAGYPVCFRGPSGSGKTTLAMHVAHLVGRPTMLLCGDDEFGTSDLIGGRTGYRRRKVVDNFIHSVLKTEEDMTQHWVDNRLTVACREGLTLVYDEFTRSRPEANNVLLAVLEERLLVLPSGRGGASYQKVHPNFTAIFTSNSNDYIGVHKAQDALRDRIITIDVDYFDRETEVDITQSRSGVSVDDAERIVDLVRACRKQGSEFGPTVRSCIMIAKVLVLRSEQAVAGNSVFEQTCIDVLVEEPTQLNKSRKKSHRDKHVVLDLIRQYCTQNVSGGLINLSLRNPHS